MTDQQREHVSAFMDGELDAQESDRLISSLRDEASLRQSWARYHLIGEALRNNLPGTVNHDLAQRVSCALDTEPTLLAPRQIASRRTTPPYFKPVVGWAMAASVAVVAVIGFNQSPTRVTPTPMPVAAVAPVATPAPISASLSPPAPLLASATPSTLPAAHTVSKEVRARFKNYLLSHRQAATVVAGGPGVLSSARLVDYEPPQ